MKQIPVRGSIKDRLQKAVGAGVDVSKHAVFEATALNNKPVRKNHPVYKGAVHTQSYMEQMSDAANAESLPLQVMHDGSVLPVGRLFHASVLNDGPNTELRALFFVDPAEQGTIDKLNNGTIDQVSVSTLPQSAKCNLCGFDFLSDDAPYSTFWSGQDPEGHQMGTDAHVVMSRMSNFNEMSLVNRGGIPGARIKSPDASAFSGANQLDAAGINAWFKQALTLELSTNDLDLTKDHNVDMTAFAASLSAAVTKSATLEAENAVLKAKVIDLEAKSAAAGDAVALKAELEVSKAATLAATDALKAVATKVLVLAGQADPAIPVEPAKIVELVEAKAANLSAAIAKAAGTHADAALRLDANASKRGEDVSAYRSPPTRR